MTKSIGTPVSQGPGSFVWELYHKLEQLYSPGGGQYFALQFPTRPLDKQTYSYKLDGSFSRSNKPVLVNEAEFALTDQLYPVTAVVGGPNGQLLSKNYEKALNSLIPTFESLAVRKQREKMRAWLMKETKSGNAAYTAGTRLSIPGINAETAKELSTETGMVITPGASGEPLSDQATAKRMALQAITAIKNSARTAPQGIARTEYSKSLMQDYLDDKKDWELRRDDMVKDVAKAAGSDPQAMEKLTRTLAHVTAIEEAKLASKYANAVARGYNHPGRGSMGHLDIKSTGELLQDAKDSFRESALSSVVATSKVYPVAMQPTDWFETLGTNFTREDLSQDPELIKAAVKAKSQLIDTLENRIANLRAFNKGDPADAKKKMDNVATANLAVHQASRLLIENMSEYTSAVAGDTRTMVEALQRQLTNAKAELAELQESFTIAHRAPPTTGTLDEVGKLPRGNGESRWSEVHIESDVSNSYTDASSTNSASVSSFGCNFWIGSYSSSSGFSETSNETASMSENLHVEISMRTTYVTVDRSSWFDPSLFDMSKSFMRGTDAMSYSTWSDWKKKPDKSDQTPQDAIKAIAENTDLKPTGYLAAFPVGYVLVKDCVIKITSSATDTSSFKKHFDQQSQSSGGFLCFSHSSGSRSSSDSNASTTKQASNGIVVRIPGPQILGYVMQLIGKDESQSFQAIPDAEMFVDD